MPAAQLTGVPEYGSLGHRQEGEHSSTPAMSLKSLIVIVGVTALPLFGAAPQTAAVAQTAQRGGPYAPMVRRVRPRIEVTPRPLLYRRCVDWYELQYRPSGTVLFPQYRCWWVRG